jgi:hypothetical protein
MRKAAVIAHFDNSPVAVARALGITRSAVNQWPKLIPLKSALRLQAVTQGALRVSMDAYKLPGTIVVRPRKRRARNGVSRAHV